jgi:hypothetical protein
MADAQRRWADASEVRNKTRPELPEILLLRLTDAVCGDLNVEHPDDGSPLASEHELIQKFADEYKSAEAIDNGEPLRQVPGKGVYRIKRDEWRGATWADKEVGIVWLCRAVSLASYPTEDKAYDAFEEMGEDLFPTDDEREAAAEDWALAHVFSAMKAAMQEAHELPNTWQVAEVDGEIIGRAHVEQIESDGVVLAHRFLVVIRKPPVTLPDGDDWLPLMIARVLPEGDGYPDFINPDDLPSGSSYRDGREVAIAQEALPFAA